MLRNLVKDNSYFFVVYLLYLIVGVGLVFYTEKGAIETYLNEHHQPVFDWFFKYYTYVGTGFFLVPFCLILLYLGKRYFLAIILSSYAISGVLVQIIKRYLISNNYRPSLYFYEKHMTNPPYSIDGVKLNTMYAFPSGHTNLAFLIFYLCALFSPNKKLGALFALLAVLVAASRMYLYQHFLIDTLGGSLIAIIISTGVYIYFESNNFKDKPFLQPPRK